MPKKSSSFGKCYYYAPLSALLLLAIVVTIFVPKGKEAVFARWHSTDAVKTEQYLYTECFDSTNNSVARMLYNHQVDPAETVNVAEQSENKAVGQEFSQMIQKKRK